MSDDFTEAAGFRLSPILPSCCRTSTTLNKLLYDWPQGFSRYRLSAMNVGATVTDEAVRTLEVALGCELRTIRHMI
jgi:hypothetical protein